MNEPAEFPPAWLPPVPREPRWRPCLFRRWPLGAAGLTLLCSSGVLFMALVSARETGIHPSNGNLLDTAMRVCLILGSCLSFWWLRGALRCRLLLRDGEPRAARLLQWRRIHPVNPNPLALRLAYSDPQQCEIEHRQWIPRPSPLGRRLEAGDSPDTLVVLVDAEGQARLVQDCDFLPRDSSR